MLNAERILDPFGIRHSSFSIDTAEGPTIYQRGSRLPPPPP
jgi:hypothetical protein